MSLWYAVWSQDDSCCCPDFLPVVLYVPCKICVFLCNRGWLTAVLCQTSNFECEERQVKLRFSSKLAPAQFFWSRNRASDKTNMAAILWLMITPIHAFKTFCMRLFLKGIIANKYRESNLNNDYWYCYTNSCFQDFFAWGCF